MTKKSMLFVVIVFIFTNSFTFSTTETLHNESMQDWIKNKLIQKISWLEDHRRESLVVAGLACFTLGIALFYIQIKQYQMQRFQYINQLQQYVIQYQQYSMINKLCVALDDENLWQRNGKLSEKSCEELGKINEDYNSVRENVLKQIMIMKKAAGQ